MKIPYIALYPAPFIADTYHLGNTELGIYWRLLLHYYQHLRPLPYDLDTVCRIAYATAPEERKAVEFILTEFFTVDTDSQGHKVWKHHRADEEIERALERVEVNQARTKAARKAKKIKRDNSCDNACDNPCDNYRDDACNEGEREREIKILDLDKEVDQRERVEGGMGGDSPPPSLSQNKLIDKKGEIPKERIEVAAQLRPELTQEEVAASYRVFLVTKPNTEAEWKTWICRERRRTGKLRVNGKYAKQMTPDEAARMEAAKRRLETGQSAFCKGRGNTNEVITHE